MRSHVEPYVFLSEVFQLRDELDNLGETVTDERLTTIILDALSEEMYSTVVKMQLVRDPDLGLEEEIIGTIKTISICHSERSSVPKRSKLSYRKVRSSGSEPRTDNVREFAMILRAVLNAPNFSSKFQRNWCQKVGT